VELIVVDNGSTDDTPAVLAGWAATAQIPCTLVSEPRAGLSIARNAAMRTAQGDIFAFTDDDCVLSETYLDDLTRHYAGDGGPIIRGGRIELGDVLDAPFTIKTLDFREQMTARSNFGGFVHGANMTLTRSVFEKIGFFDERFGAGTRLQAGEDTDYLLRAFAAGITVEYVPDMTVYHFHGRRDPKEIRKLVWGYSIANGALMAKHRHVGLARNIYWDVKNAVKELWGGSALSRDFGLTYRSIVANNVRGIVRYYWVG